MNEPAVKAFQPAKPGTKLAGFNVLAEIGRGAASVIYLVQDPKNKQVWALKHVVRHTAKDDRFLEQAEREYEVSSKVKHPAIRSIERVIKAKSGLLTVKELFLLMEYVDGVSVERHPPETFALAVRIFLQVARALDAMHQHGFVHADMKPNNVVVNDEGRVKLIDLGQACPIGTVKERIQGTPDFIAPEQVHLRPITVRTDVYNLGATMYSVLAGRPIPTALSRGDSLVGSKDDAFIEKPAPVTDFNPDVPEALSALIMECVEVDPEKRPGEMKAIADRLETIAAAIGSGVSGGGDAVRPGAK